MVYIVGKKHRSSGENIIDDDGGATSEKKVKRRSIMRKRRKSIKISLSDGNGGIKDCEINGHDAVEFDVSAAVSPKRRKGSKWS